MRIIPAWFVLAVLQPAPVPPPVVIGPAQPRPAMPVDPGPLVEPSDEDILRDSKTPTDGPGLVEFFRQRQLQPGDEERVKGLILQLGDEDFDKREEASIQLRGLGLRAKQLLLAARHNPNPEIAFRAKECLKEIDEGTVTAAVGAAVRLLARRKPEGAAAALLDFLPAAGEEDMMEQVRLSLVDLAVRDGKADPVLVQALTDASPLKRAAAAFALGRCGLADALPAVRKLQEDPDPLVRYQAAMALAAAHDKTAVPALIDLLDQLPRLECSRVEEVLNRIADDKTGPAPPPAALDPDARRKYRDAWKAWWIAGGMKADADRLADAARTNGYTLVILLDQNRVLELDRANHPRLDVSQLNFPLDAQLLPNDHILAAEHNGNRVTERDAAGKVVWEKEVDLPLVAQRLPNGNTFIATQMELIEVNKGGGMVSELAPPNGEAVMKAQKLPNGEIAMVVQPPGAAGTGTGARFVLLSDKGKEERTFPVNLHYSGGRIDVLPNGNVLIPEADFNRVVELNTKGEVIWTAGANEPIAAVRLANGDTLITTYGEHRAVEVDQDGKEVWEGRRDTRVTRAFRR
ncbi:MAG TPA: HEAT repeat domain-containing protein [Gemmataceae bacterium]|nr:HEAT repeat domain-containing protein [Gemmataceae bacterium]